MLTVNLTTTSSRLDLCAPTLLSLVEQDYAADRIVVWVSHDAYMADEGIADINAMGAVARLVDQYPAIEIAFVANTGPYRKIMPALERASEEDWLVYCDDDVIYAKGWLAGLVDAFRRHHEAAVVATRVRRRQRSITGRWKGYMAFPLVQEEGAVDEPIITGVGGALLKKGLINADYRVNQDYTKVAPRADDLWLSKIILLSHTPVIACPQLLGQVMQIQHSAESLDSQNNLGLTQKSLVGKLCAALYYIALIQLGRSSSNNDTTLRRVDAYFDHDRA